MVTVEFSGAVYSLGDDQAAMLAQNLRNYAKGSYPADVKLATELSGNPNWIDGALAVADFLEEIPRRQSRRPAAAGGQGGGIDVLVAADHPGPRRLQR